MHNKFSIRDKSILVGLYFSKFDKSGLNELGFENYTEAFNTIGFALGSKPASIKNYRDEFDPFFPNPRLGWHKRNIRDYCKKVYDDFSSLDFVIFSDLIKSFLFKEYELNKFIKKIEKSKYSAATAKRLLTGIAAEEYFKINYKNIFEFKNFSITDTTKNACGFDFKMDLGLNYYCVEVKGLNTNSGNIMLTEKEFFIAKSLKEKYLSDYQIITKRK